MAKSAQPKPKSAASRQAAYHKRMRDAGLTRLSVWVPEAGEAREDFDRTMKRLRKKWEKANLYPS